MVIDGKKRWSSATINQRPPALDHAMFPPFIQKQEGESSIAERIPIHWRLSLAIVIVNQNF
jgi:hypothetical protein